MADVMNINNPRVAEGGGEGSEEGSSVDDGRDHLIRRTSRVHADIFLGEDIASLAGDNPRGTSTPGAVFIVMNATLGAAMLSLPYAANQCGGLLIFLLMQYAFAFLAAISMIILAKCADVGNASVYQEVVETMTGSDLWVTFTRIMIAIYAFSSCVAYLVLVGDQGQEIVKFMVGSEDFSEHSDLYRRMILLGMSCAVVLPLMMPRSISFLELPGIVSFLSVLYVALAVAFLYNSEKVEDANIKTRPDNGKAVFNSLPTIAFGYQCHVSGVPVYCSLKNRNLRNWIFILGSATLLSSLIYSITTIFGYLTFGDTVADDILLSYPSSSVAMLIGRIGVMISVMMSYPVIHYCGRVCLEDVYRHVMNLSNHEGNRTWTRRYYIQTVTWFVLSLIGAEFIPGINKVVNIIGAFAAFFILGFPGLCIFRYGTISDDYLRDPVRFEAEESIVKNMTDPLNPQSRKKSQLYMIVGSIYIVLCAFLFGEAFTSGVTNLF